MVVGWFELITRRPLGGKREFVSVDALGGPYDLKMNSDPRSYELLSRDKDGMLTPVLTVREGPIYPPLRSYLASTDSASPGGATSEISPDPAGARRTPDYFGQAAKYQTPTASFSSPRPPTRDDLASQASWDQGHVGAASPGRSYSPPTSYHYSQHSYSQAGENMNPLQMNRI